MSAWKLGFFILVAPILVFALSDFFHFSVYRYGVFPRDVSTLHHILTAPFIHGSVNHLVSNTIALAMLLVFIAPSGARYLFKSTLVIVFLGGMFVWLVGRPANHIGASGLVYGFWALVITRAYYQRKFSYIVASIVVLIFQGGMVYGMFPSKGFVSYEAHLGGAIAGWVFARNTHFRRFF